MRIEDHRFGWTAVAHVVFLRRDVVGMHRGIGLDSDSIYMLYDVLLRSWMVGTPLMGHDSFSAAFLALILIDRV